MAGQRQRLDVTAGGGIGGFAGRVHVEDGRERPRAGRRHEHQRGHGDARLRLQRDLFDAVAVAADLAAGEDRRLAFAVRFDAEAGAHQRAQPGGVSRLQRGSARVQPLGHRPVQRLHRLAFERRGKLSRLGAVEVRRRLGVEGGLGALVNALVQPSLHPAVGRLAPRLRPAVRIVVLEQIDALPGAEDLVDAARFGEGRSRALDREIIADGRHHPHRLRREGDQEIAEIEAVFQKPGEVLLRVLRPGAGPELLPGREVARRRGRSQPRLHHLEVGRLCPAARVAGHADALGIHVLARQQVVQAAHAVPQFVARDVGPGQQALDAGHGVLGGAAEARAAEIDVEILGALALRRRVVSQHQDAAPGQRDPHPLVERESLAAGAVAGRAQHRGIGRPAAVRHVDVGGDVVARQAFVDQLLDAVAVALQRPGDAGVERCPLGKASQRLDHALADVGLPLGHFSRCAQRGHLRRPRLPMLPGDSGEVPLDHPAEPAGDPKRFLGEEGW